MPEVTRRTLLRALGVAAAGAAAFGAFEVIESRHNSAPRLASGQARSIAEENRRKGSTSWKIVKGKTQSSTDIEMQIKGFASKTSVHVGDSIDFHVSVDTAQQYTIDIYRYGWYAGKGARHVTASPSLAGTNQPAPVLDTATGTITCPWAKSWTLAVPSDWVSGFYVGVLTSASGFRNYVPFVVRDGRAADLLVVIPFTTYQAYNQFPLDGQLGKSLYEGYSPAARVAPGPHDIKDYAYEHRAINVSFERPWDSNGMPRHADGDQSFAFWAEKQGYDMTYATSLDLHGGALDLSQYAGIVFSGHDEYWSRQMRDKVTSAVATGTSLAYMSANNVYWHIRCDAPTAVGEVRSMTCYKLDPDPDADISGATTQWRDISPTRAEAEQGLLGVQYNGIVETESPLVVKNANHWMWNGTGVKDGDEIPGVVGIEADGFTPGTPSPAGSQTLLSASPFTYTTNQSRQIQTTSVCEMPSGALVFAAATMNWALVLGKAGKQDARIQTATANVISRIVRRA